MCAHEVIRKQVGDYACLQLTNKVCLLALITSLSNTTAATVRLVADWRVLLRCGRSSTTPSYLEAQMHVLWLLTIDISLDRSCTSTLPSRQPRLSCNAARRGHSRGPCHKQFKSCKVWHGPNDRQTSRFLSPLDPSKHCFFSLRTDHSRCLEGRGVACMNCQGVLLHTTCQPSPRDGPPPRCHHLLPSCSRGSMSHLPSSSSPSKFYTLAAVTIGAPGTLRLAAPARPVCNPSPR